MHKSYPNMDRNHRTRVAKNLKIKNDSIQISSIRDLLINSEVSKKIQSENHKKIKKSPEIKIENNNIEIEFKKKKNNDIENNDSFLTRKRRIQQGSQS